MCTIVLYREYGRGVWVGIKLSVMLSIGYHQFYPIILIQLMNITYFQRAVIPYEISCYENHSSIWKPSLQKKR